METVFAKELLLKTILENLGPGDLKVARRVSKQWNYRATRILLAKQLLTVTHAFQNEPNDEHAQKLLALETTMKESALFPACAFAFPNSNFKSPDLEHLLHTFGHWIHTLNISLDNGNLPGVTGRELLHSFKHVLFVHLPNLERLTLASKITLLPEPEMSEEIEETSSSGSSSNSNLLGKLKFLRVESALPGIVFEYIIKAGVKISEVELVPPRHEELLDVLRRTGKMHLLTSAVIIFTKDNLVLISRFGNSNLHLRKLQIFLSPKFLGSRDIFLQATKIMATVLEKSAHSLEHMIVPPLFYLQESQVPLMPRLKELIIFIIENCSEAFARKTFKMSRAFPRLSTIFIQYPHGTTMSSNTWTKEMYEKSFLGADYNDTVSSVTALQFINEPEFACIQKLPLFFPNIKTLLIGNLSKPAQALDVLWSLPFLASLDFTVGIGTLEKLEDASWNWNSNTFTSLDAALTGISEETCAHLLSSSSEFLDADADSLKKLRLKNSMVDAKRLRCLTIGVIDDSSETRKSPTKALLSNIALKYAFEMCPNAKVKITLSGKEEENVKYLLAGILSVLSSNVEIKEEKKSLNVGRITVATCMYTLTL